MYLNLVKKSDDNFKFDIYYLIIANKKFTSCYKHKNFEQIMGKNIRYFH